MLSAASPLRATVAALIAAIAAGCASDPSPDGAQPSAAASAAGASYTPDTAWTRAMNEIAEPYVKLALAIGVHDADYVDAYYGPPEWRTEVEQRKQPLADIARGVDSLIARLEQTPSGTAEIERLRHAYLGAQLRAMQARLRMLQGTKLSFDEESRALYDAVAPTNTEEHFKRILARLEKELPGSGPIAERYQEFRKAFIVPPALVDTVFKTAVAACRERTARHLTLPDGESFVIEYVTGKPWSGYNWYKGNYHSLIQVNTSLPIYIDRALDLACHEGYPGHHAYNVLLEHHLVREKGWVEFSVYPLFSPQSLIAEGSANYGVDIAFPGAERVAYERGTLFPLAGLPAERAEEYYRVQDIVRELSYAGNEAARRYLNGEIDAAAAADWLVRYALMSPAAAQQRVRFFDTYRSYVINYNLGLDLVREYVERVAGPNATPEARWRVFSDLLASPRLPSGLR